MWSAEPNPVTSNQQIERLTMTTATEHHYVITDDQILGGEPILCRQTTESELHANNSASTNTRLRFDRRRTRREVELP
jgi:hypothetical protein